MFGERFFLDNLYSLFPYLRIKFYVIYCRLSLPLTGQFNRCINSECLLQIVELYYFGLTVTKITLFSSFPRQVGVPISPLPPVYHYRNSISFLLRFPPSGLRLFVKYCSWTLVYYIFIPDLLSNTLFSPFPNTTNYSTF